jgi:hypothetical protein
MTAKSDHVSEYGLTDGNNDSGGWDHEDMPSTAESQKDHWATKERLPNPTNESFKSLSTRGFTPVLMKSYQWFCGGGIPPGIRDDVKTLLMNKQFKGTL